MFSKCVVYTSKNLLLRGCCFPHSIYRKSGGEANWLVVVCCCTVAPRAFCEARDSKRKIKNGFYIICFPIVWSRVFVSNSVAPIRFRQGSVRTLYIGSIWLQNSMESSNLASQIWIWLFAQNVLRLFLELSLFAGFWAVLQLISEGTIHLDIPTFGMEVCLS